MTTSCSIAFGASVPTRVFVTPPAAPSTSGYATNGAHVRGQSLTWSTSFACAPTPGRRSTARPDAHGGPTPAHVMYTIRHSFPPAGSAGGADRSRAAPARPPLDSKLCLISRAAHLVVQLTPVSTRRKAAGAAM